MTIKKITLVTAAALMLATGASGFPKAEEEASKQHHQPKAEVSDEMIKKGREEARRLIVAKVNGSGITMESVVMMMNRLASRKGHMGSKSDATEEIRKEAMDRLVIQELAYQKAKAVGLKVDESAIDQAVANFKENVGGEEPFKKYLDSEALTEKDMRAQVERSLLLELIFAQEVYAKVVIPENVLREEYEQVKGKYVTPEKVVVTDVIFFLKKDDAASLEKVKGVLKTIHNDKDKNPWNLVLDGSFIVRNYEIVKEKDKELYEAALKLKQNELSDIITTPDSYHIVKLKEYTPNKQYTFEEVKTSLEGKFRVDAQQQRLKEWELELRKDAKIEIFDHNAAHHKSS